MIEDDNARAIALLASTVGTATLNISERLISLELDRAAHIARIESLEQCSAIDHALITILNRKVRDLIESHGR